MVQMQKSRNLYLGSMARINAGIAFLTILFATMLSSGVNAAEPKPWQMNFQPAATPVMEKITDFHNLLLIVETIIVVFVLIVMLYIVIKFNEKSNPEPSKTTHNTALEVIWTVIPIVILMVNFYEYVKRKKIREKTFQAKSLKYIFVCSATPNFSTCSTTWK